MGWVSEELHGRITQVFMCIIAALVGFATLLLGGFSRFGVWRNIVYAFAILVILEGLKNGVSAPVRNDATLWPLMYLPPLTGALIVVGMLYSKTRSFKIRKAVQP